MDSASSGPRALGGEDRGGRSILLDRFSPTQASSPISASRSLPARHPRTPRSFDSTQFAIAGPSTPRNVQGSSFDPSHPFIDLTHSDSDESEEYEVEILSPSLRRVTAGAKERLTEDEVQRVERVFELQEQRQQQQQHQAGGRRLDEAEGGGRGAVKPDARKKGRSSTASKSRSGKHHSTSRDSSTPRRRGSPPYSPRRPSPSPSPSPPPPHIDRWELEDLIPQQHFPGIDVRIGGGNDYQVRENQGGRMVTMARGTLPRAGPEAFMRIGRFPPHPRHHPLPGAPAVGARPGGWTDPAEGAWDAALGDDYRHGRLQHLANVHGGVPAVRGGRGAGQ